MPALCALSETLLAALGESIGLQDGALRAVLGSEPDVTLKLVRYPPRSGPDGASSLLLMRLSVCAGAC